MKLFSAIGIRWVALLFLLCTGCEKYGLVLRQQRVDSLYLASTHVGSPDPRQKCPPSGQMLIVEWWVPPPLLKKEPRIIVQVLFRDYSEQIMEFPIQKRVGYETFLFPSVAQDPKRAMLAYKAEIVTGDGEVYREWKHQMWVKLIEVKEEEGFGSSE